MGNGDSTGVCLRRKKILIGAAAAIASVAGSVEAFAPPQSPVLACRRLTRSGRPPRPAPVTARRHLDPSRPVAPLADEIASDRTEDPLSEGGPSNESVGVWPPGDGSAVGTSRRSALLRMAAFPSAAAAATILANPQAAVAGKAEIDKSGQLFSPKAQMLGGGGSEAARGMRLRDRSKDTAQQSLKERNFGGVTAPVQTLYETRFIAYLSRFLLNFDPAVRAWWVEQEQKLSATSSTNKSLSRQNAEKLRFAEFAESVEVGLADYFLGPYGSYASVQAAMAGLSAAAPATSEGVKSGTAKNSIFSDALQGLWNPNKREDTPQSSSKTSKRKKSRDETVTGLARQGILNLFTLLKARYTTIDAKRQLATLFSFISDSKLQPSAEIRGLLGEVDNATVGTISLAGLGSSTGGNATDIRLSSRRGGGYSVSTRPEVIVEPPPALGVDYRTAKVAPIMRRTGRILRISVTDGGAGYKSAPNVKVVQRGVRRPCEACAIINRIGEVDSVLVLDPGMGYGSIGGEQGETSLPSVEIDPPKGAKNRGSIKTRRGVKDQTEDEEFRPAAAVADLEYELYDVRVLDGGNGYITTEPPRIAISPPNDDPDWFISPIEQKRGWRPKELLSSEVTATVTTMHSPTDNTTGWGVPFSSLNMQEVLDQIKDDPLALLPSDVRPERIASGSNAEPTYAIPAMPPVPTRVTLPSVQYRAIDPIFGGVGTKPVTKGARDLSADEYTRLALSGAVCTVIVRTLLNPLELVKTKIQLGNDEELNRYAVEIVSKGKGEIQEQDSGLVGLGKDRRETPKSTSSLRNRKGGSSISFGGKQGDDEAEGQLALLTKPTEKIIQHEEDDDHSKQQLGTLAMMQSMVKLRGFGSLFQSADITFLASVVFGSFGFGATELFRRSFASAFFEDGASNSGGLGSEIVLLLAAAIACILTSAAAAPFEIIRVKSMALLEPTGWREVLKDFVVEKRQERGDAFPRSGEPIKTSSDFQVWDIRKEDIGPLWGGFGPIASRELPFAITKFLVFDLLAQLIIGFINSQSGVLEPVQVGVGPSGLAVSAAAGAIAGIAGAVISHPADLILTLTSSAAKSPDASISGDKTKIGSEETPGWVVVVKGLLEKEGGISNLFVGLPARAAFFFLVIGLQFFLYDYVKGLFRVGSDDLTLVLDVFYAVRQGLVNVGR